MKNKRPASMLISAILASVMFIIIANSFMNLWGNSFTTLTAAKTATEAQNLSDIVSEKLKLEGVDAEEVTTKTPLSDITGNDDDDDWLYTYEIGNEFEDDDGNIFKVAEVKIYKDGEDNPRYSTEIPLSSSGNSDGLEVGMVVAWTLSSNPSDNYLECNGQGVDKNKYPKLYQLMHNVPDYRGVFLRGNSEERYKEMPLEISLEQFQILLILQAYFIRKKFCCPGIHMYHREWDLMLLVLFQLQMKTVQSIRLFVILLKPNKFFRK